MRTEVARMLSGKGFLMALALCIAAILFGTAYSHLEGTFEPGHFLNLEKNALCSKVVYFLMPVTAVLPWSDSVLTEWKGGFLKSVLPRLNRRVYTENKILTVALGSFFSWIAAGMVVLLLFFVVYFPFERKGKISVYMMWELSAILLRLGLIAAIIGSIGGICAVLSGSFYLAFGFPFVGYYFCIILQERYFPKATWLYPPEWIVGNAGWGENKEGLWLFLLLFLGVVVGLHGSILYGKLDEL